MAAWESMSDDAYDVSEAYGEAMGVHAFYDLTLDELDAAITEAALLVDGIGAELDREDWPIHQPGPAYDAPIPGLHWYGGCEPGYPRVNPATGVCEGCGETACALCGREACPDHPVATLRVLMEPLNRIMVSLEDAAA